VKDAYNDLRALYRAARRQEDPTRADRRAVRAALLGIGAASVAVQASAAGAKLVAAIPAAAKMYTVGQLVGLVSVGVALGSSVAVIGHVTSLKPAAQVSSVPAPNQQPTRQIANAAPVSSPEPESPTEPAANAAASPATNNQQPATSNQQPTRQPATSNQQPATLVAESRGLAEVQSALSAQDPAKALQLLSAQDSAFRSGALGQERAAARVIALCAAGRIVDASVARERFLSTYPTSPLAKRVSGACSK
jgi:hypothetical protein